MKSQTKFKQTEIGNKLKELKTLHLEMECRLLNIAKGDEGNYKKLIKDYFLQFENMILNYKLLSEKNSNLYDHSIEILLNSAVEGLIKLILFHNDYISYLSIDKKNRSLGVLKKNILKILKIKENKKEKINIVNILLDTIQELRNNFIHFSFYSQKDYRFEYVYFQLIAYFIDKFHHWEKLDEKTSSYIKQIAKNKPNGIDLLDGVKLYE